MPYIPKEDRNSYDDSLHMLGYRLTLPEISEEELAGHLNYCISKLCFTLFDSRRRYVRINTIVGALEGAKQEFIRRKVAPYEDEKIESQGDI